MPNETAALFQAVRAGDAAAVERELRANPALATATGPHPIWGGQPTALHVAAENDHLRVAELLFESGADANAPSAGYDHWTPLQIAIGGGRRAFVDLLLARGARVDPWEAAALGDTERLRAQIAADPEAVRARRVNDAPPLHFASTVDVARLLVDAGAPLDALDKYGSTAARSAAYSGPKRADVARFLMERSGEGDLWMYAALDDVSGLSALVAQGADVNAIRKGINPGSGPDEAPLHTAAALANVAATEFLLAQGASPNGVAGNDATPLHYAAKAGSRAVVDLLLAAGANSGAADESHGATAADWARFFGHRAISEYLNNGVG